MTKKALITGITGQDGSYLAELLLAKGYEVHGIVRRSSVCNTDRIDHLLGDGSGLVLHYGDLTDSGRLAQLCGEVRPDEIYNLAAQSDVGVSFDMPEYSGEVDALGTIRLLEAVRRSGLGREVRFYQASTSELFGMASECPQRETTPFHPCSPYAVAKLYAYWAVRNYREAYGIFAANGILFNHESPRRGETFVTRKITLAAARIKLGFQDKLYLGNLDARRDWGFAGDFVEGMWRILQHDRPDDFVLATGETHTVREFLEAAFGRLGLDWREHVVHDPALERPLDAESLAGDPSKARRELGWEPKVKFADLVAMMVDADLELARRA